MHVHFLPYGLMMIDLMHVKAFLFMEQVEIWLPVVGYEGLYEISNLGRLKACKKTDSKGNRREEFIMKQSVTRCGYCQVQLCKNAVKIKKYIHRLVAHAFITNHENKPQVNHIDGDKQNNCVSNLEWNSLSENYLHAYSSGLNKGKKGIKCNFVKLNEVQVIEIKELIKEMVKDYIIAQKYGVSRTCIHDIRTNKRWKHLNENTTTIPK